MPVDHRKADVNESSKGLRGYRLALIPAAVTGNIDVRHEFS